MSIRAQRGHLLIGALTGAAVLVASPAMAASPVFPSTVNAKYAKEKPARARLKTCADQYKANKATGGNAGLKWVQKGGGYWSQCNKKLKG